MAVQPHAGIGPLVRQWRERRQLSQLALALDADISARHLSFIETGRSKPGRDILLRITDRLALPLREQNQLLLAAGFAPQFPERPLADPSLAPVREALDVIIAGHEPYPAAVVDRYWNIVAASSAMLLVAPLIDPSLLEPPINAMRAGLHPKGLAKWITNLAEVRAYFLGRLQHQVTQTADPTLAALLEEVAGYPDPAPISDSTGPTGAGLILTPQIQLRLPDGSRLSLFATVLTFGTAADVTASELSIELGFPADRDTATQLASMVGQLAAPSRPAPP